MFPAEHAPPDVDTAALFTGARSVRNIAMYERAGYLSGVVAAPDNAIGLVKPLERPGG